MRRGFHSRFFLCPQRNVSPIPVRRIRMRNFTLSSSIQSNMKLLLERHKSLSEQLYRRVVHFPYISSPHSSQSSRQNEFIDPQESFHRTCGTHTQNHNHPTSSIHASDNRRTHGGSHLIIFRSLPHVFR